MHIALQQMCIIYLACQVQLEAEAAALRESIRESHLAKFRSELRNRSRVLRRLGHINEEGVVQLKVRMLEGVCYRNCTFTVYVENIHEKVSSMPKCYQRVAYETLNLEIQGRAACEVDAADELIITELMMEGAFNDLDHHQTVALVSCLVPTDKSNEEVIASLQS